MHKIKFFIFTVLISLLVLLFYNCAPLTEKGNFVEESIRITGFDSQNDGSSDGSDGGDDGDDGSSDGGDDGSSDGSDDGDDGSSDGSEPIGDEFGGSETPEEGPAPITRTLY